ARDRECHDRSSGASRSRCRVLTAAADQRPIAGQGPPHRRSGGCRRARDGGAHGGGGQSGRLWPRAWRVRDAARTGEGRRRRFCRQAEGKARGGSPDRRAYLQRDEELRKGWKPSMIRILLFLFVVLALALGFSRLADRPGEIVITFNGYQYEVSLMVAAV